MMMIMSLTLEQGSLARNSHTGLVMLLVLSNHQLNNQFLINPVHTLKYFYTRVQSQCCGAVLLGILFPY